MSGHPKFIIPLLNLASLRLPSFQLWHHHFLTHPVHKPDSHPTSLTCSSRTLLITKPYPINSSLSLSLKLSLFLNFYCDLCSGPCCLLYILMTQLGNSFPIGLINFNLSVLHSNQVNLIYSLLSKNLNCS